MRAGTWNLNHAWFAISQQRAQRTKMLEITADIRVLTVLSTPSELSRIPASQLAAPPGTALPSRVHVASPQPAAQRPRAASCNARAARRRRPPSSQPFALTATGQRPL